MTPHSQRRTGRSRYLRPVTILLPTLRFWLILLAPAMVLGVVVLQNLREFLAPVALEKGARVVVLDTWGGTGTTQFVVPRLRSDQYSRIIAVGTPLDQLSPMSSYGTNADLLATRLMKAGIEEDRLEIVRVPTMKRHRTAHSALAVARHLSKEPVDALDLVTVATHGRRSRDIYRAALLPTRVGVLSTPDPNYSGKWWQSSAGVRSVIGELLAWLYATLISDEVDRARAEWRRLPPERKKIPLGPLSVERPPPR